MLLTLEVVSAQGEVLGSNRRKTIGPNGAQIGRAKENDWVISDQYISRVNARVRFVNGAFYIEGLGRNPLAMHEATNVVPNNTPQLLRNGERFFLDQYEIRATITADPALAPVSDPLDPFANELPPTERHGWPGEAGLVGDIGIGAGEDSAVGNLDPLAVLGLGGPVSHPQAPKHIELNQVGALNIGFQPPSPILETGPHETVPDGWEGRRVPGPVPTETPRPREGSSTIPDSWALSRLTQIEKGSPLQPVVATNASGRRNEAPIQAPVQLPGQPAHVPPVQVPHVHVPPVHVPPVQGPPQRPTSPPGPAPRVIAGNPSEATAGLEQVLQAAGLPGAKMTPEIAAEIGEVLRVVVQGVMEALQSRAEVKSQLRMSMTRIGPTENNPLKFAPNVEAALHTLLVERNRGYLPTVRAFEEAFNDIRNHQIAVLQGIRVAFDNLLEQFDPERIEAEMDPSAKRGGLLGVGSRSRLRDHYKERFARLTEDRDECFRRLFGRQFADAYEEQMARFQAAARHSGRRE